jgi:glutaminyl-peptide cyclotransferase
MRDGSLYESTGFEGRSTISRINPDNGRVLKSVQLPANLFGEGIVDWNNEIFSVTWHGGKGFRWSLPDLRQTGTFRFSGEGWGMTHDQHNLILSDGTPILRFLDPVTLKVVRRLRVTLKGALLAQINELEYVRGEILANIWTQGVIARIDPGTGRVKGLLDLRNLWTEVGNLGPDAVPNGIAYDKDKDRLFVTGKNWPVLFEVRRPGAR